MLKKFFMLDNTVPKKIRRIFYIGFIPVIYLSYLISFNLAMAFPVSKIRYRNNSNIVLSRATGPNVILGILAEIIILALLLYLWNLIVNKLQQDLEENEGKVLNKLFAIGSLSATKVINMLFYAGVLLFVVPGLSFANFLQNFNFVGNSFSRLGSLFSLILVYLIWIVIWKLVCELLLIIFKCFEVYYQSKKKEL